LPTNLLQQMKLAICIIYIICIIVLLVTKVKGTIPESKGSDTRKKREKCTKEKGMLPI